MPLDTILRAETPEGVALALRPAGVVARGLAYLIDFGIRLGIFFAAGMLAGALGGMGQAFLLIAYFGLEWLYPVAFELARGGATPGKRTMGLQVVMDSGLPVTPAASLIRNLLRAADFMPALYAAGATSMLVRADFKRLGDMAAGTLVVHAQTISLHGPVPEAAPLSPARALSQGEQAAVVAWAARATRLTSARFDELAGLAASVSGTVPGAPDTTARLLGVAHWILGRRSNRE